MPTSPQELFACLDCLGIRYETTEHPPVFTAKEGRAIESSIPGVTCKNLFLKDKKGTIFLVVLPAEKRADLKAIEKRAGTARLSFGSAELLQEVLQIMPGSVTPFALMNDVQKRVHVILDDEMMRCDLTNYHPLHNAASTSLVPSDLLRFIEHLGYAPQIVDCGTE